MRKYDLHVHTYYSKCSLMSPASAVRAAMRRGLDGIAVTDHNTIAGALEARKLAPKGFEVIVGEEIDTDKGHILAYFLKRAVKPGSFGDVVFAVKKQGGLVALSHPYDFTRQHLHGKAPKVDAIESFNGRMRFPFGNRLARRLAARMGVAAISGSDAHFSFEVGRSRSCFNGELRDAIRRRQIILEGKGLLSPAAGLLSCAAFALHAVRIVHHRKH